MDGKDVLIKDSERLERLRDEAEASEQVDVGIENAKAIAALGEPLRNLSADARVAALEYWSEMFGVEPEPDQEQTSKPSALDGILKIAIPLLGAYAVAKMNSKAADSEPSLASWMTDETGDHHPFSSGYSEYLRRSIDAHIEHHNTDDKTGVVYVSLNKLVNILMKAIAKANEAIAKLPVAVPATGNSVLAPEAPCACDDGLSTKFPVPSGGISTGTYTSAESPIDGE